MARAFALHVGKPLKIDASAVAAESGPAGEPGAVVALGRDGDSVACGEGVLRLGRSRRGEGDGRVGVRRGTARGDGGTAIVRDAVISVLARVDRDGGLRRHRGRPRAARRGIPIPTRGSDGARDGDLAPAWHDRFRPSPFLARALEQTDVDVRKGLRVGAYRSSPPASRRRGAERNGGGGQGGAGGGAGGFVNDGPARDCRRGRFPSFPRGRPRRASRGGIGPAGADRCGPSPPLGEAETRAFLAARPRKSSFALLRNPFRVVTEALARRFATKGKNPPAEFARTDSPLSKRACWSGRRGVP